MRLEVHPCAQVRTVALTRRNHFTLAGRDDVDHALEWRESPLPVLRHLLVKQNDDVASWSDTTIKKLKQVLTNSLVECEYLDSIKSEKLNPVIICPELEDEIRTKKDLAALPAFNCFR